MSRSPARTSLLRHDRPGRRPHFDWLIELPPASREPVPTRVPTFRLPRRLDLAPPGAVVPALRIADHRQLYLELEAVRVLDGDRGVVTPRRRGSVELVERSAIRRDRSDGPDHAWCLAVAWALPSSTSRLRLEPLGGERWRVTVLSSQQQRG